MKSTETQSVLKVLLLTTSFPLTRKSRSGIFLQKMVNHLPDNIQVTVLTPDSTETDTRSPVVGYSVLPFRYAPKHWQQLAHGSGGILAALARNKLLFLLLPPFLCSNLLTCCYAARKGDVCMPIGQSMVSLPELPDYFAINRSSLPYGAVMST